MAWQVREDRIARLERAVRILRIPHDSILNSLDPSSPVRFERDVLILLVNEARDALGETGEGSKDP